MDAELETLLREKARQRFGKAFAEKASGRLLAGLNKVPSNFKRIEHPGPGTAEHSVIVETIDVFDVKPVVFADNIEPSIEARRQWRKKWINDWQSAVLKKINSIAVALVPNPTDIATPENSAKVSWVNGCIQTSASFDWLAEVAQDPIVSFLDLPRSMEREIFITGERTRATQFRIETSLTGRGIVVALVDGEIFGNHPALKGRVHAKANYTQEDWGHPDWHATAVAGIAGSADKRYTGMAPEADFFNYKVFPTKGKRKSSDFLGALGIGSALVDGADIINLSWGNKIVGRRKSREARACDVAWAAGAVVVKSAGNLGAKQNRLTIPADADGIIVVGATNLNCTAIAPYSSGGSPGEIPQKPHLVAPGGTEEEIMITCHIDGTFKKHAWGTSYAAPHVSGIIALLLQQTTMSPDQVRNDLLENYCKKISGVALWLQGAGVINMK